MKNKLFFALILGIASSIASPAFADRWVYDGARYSDSAGCSKGGRHTNMSWRGPESRKFDKAVLYRDDVLSWDGKVVGKRTALLQWSKPLINPSTGKIQMTLHAKPMEGSTNTKVEYQGYTEKGVWGSGAIATSRRPHVMKGKQHWLSLNTDGPKRAQKYEIHVNAFDGRKCTSNNLAVYYFHKVKAFEDDFNSPPKKHVLPPREINITDINSKGTYPEKGVLKGDHYVVNQRNGPYSQYVIKRFDQSGVHISRIDISGRTKGIRGEYKGKLTGNRSAAGTATWTRKNWNKPLYGKWTASW